MIETAKVAEIFTSIKGEGIFSGKRQLFVRFSGCNLKCSFCDTPILQQEAKEYNAAGLFEHIAQSASPQNIHSISLTGGEPLLQAEFLKQFLPELKRHTYKVYLETNGTLPGQLDKVIDYIDIIAMDIKLPSSCGMPDFWKEHSQFLDVAMKKQVFVKLIITDKTTYTDISRAIFLVKYKNPYIAFILQPVSPNPDIGAVEPKLLDMFKNIASEHLCKVKIIPQMHKLYGVK